jgi:hypothetical protein
LRISLTYNAPTHIGKTTVRTDTFPGHFVKLVTNEQVVEVVEFETPDPALRGEMTIMIALADADGGPEILAVHDGLPAYRPPTTRPAGGRHSGNSRRSSRRARLDARCPIAALRSVFVEHALSQLTKISKLRRSTARATQRATVRRLDCL